MRVPTIPASQTGINETPAPTIAGVLLFCSYFKACGFVDPKILGFATQREAADRLRASEPVMLKPRLLERCGRGFSDRSMNS